ncbi:hypothetical protein U3A58_20900, partial [Algoriphagus sp. C2-6-M1]|nr:hypothetical protein [Algoriphagus sp. C2-6-M1]
NPRILTGIQAVFKERPKIKRNNQQKGLSLNQMKVFRRTAVGGNYKKTMEQLRKCISNQINIDKESLESIVSSFEIETIKKGEFFLKSGKICRKMAFIESGYLRICVSV